eukprot:5846970-Amphidinium_carterae.1
MPGEVTAGKPAVRPQLRFRHKGITSVETCWTSRPCKGCQEDRCSQAARETLANFERHARVQSHPTSLRASKIWFQN